MRSAPVSSFTTSRVLKNRVGRVRSADRPDARRDDDGDARAHRRGGATTQTADRRPNPSGRRHLRRRSSLLVVDDMHRHRLPPRASIGSQVPAGAVGWVLQHPARARIAAGLLIACLPGVGCVKLPTSPRAPPRASRWWSPSATRRVRGLGLCASASTDPEGRRVRFRLLLNGCRFRRRLTGRGSRRAVPPAGWRSPCPRRESTGSRFRRRMPARASPRCPIRST